MIIYGEDLEPIGLTAAEIQASEAPRPALETASDLRFL